MAPFSRRDPLRGPGPSRRVLLLVLASIAVIALDASTGGPIDPLRSVVGNVMGPAETATAAAVRPFGQLGSFFSDNRDLRHQVATLSAENSRLRSRSELAPLQRNEAAQLAALDQTSQRTGYALVSARVVALGAAQSFSRTATIDVGTSSGVRADMTVLNGDGLVGRVVSATRTTATVLLIVDPNSVVGGRLGSDLELGNVTGLGSLSGSGGLGFDLVDDQVTPAKGDVVSTWGSKNGVPYVAGIPVGRVVAVYSTPRNLAVHAVLHPFVDFSSLDVVGVVVPRSTHGDRPLITPGSASRGSR